MWVRQLGNGRLLAEAVAQGSGEGKACPAAVRYHARDGPHAWGAGLEGQLGRTVSRMEGVQGIAAVCENIRYGIPWGRWGPSGTFRHGFGACWVPGWSVRAA